MHMYNYKRNKFTFKRTLNNCFPKKYPENANNCLFSWIAVRIETVNITAHHVSDNIFHFRRFLKKHKLNLELTLKKLSVTQASIQSFPGEEEDRTENIAVEIQPILRPN